MPDVPAPLVLSDPRRVGLVAAELIVNRLIARPAARLLLPSGRTPEDMYAALRERAAAGGLAGARPTILQLEEYAGIPPGDPRSRAAQLAAALDGVRRAALCTIDGAAPDLAAEAARYEAEVEGAPIDLAVLGLGRDGRVAFDGPPASHASGVRVVELAPGTAGDIAATRALTVGLGTIYRARELLLLVTGAAKADALQTMLEGDPGPESPAALLRDHPRLTVICDRAAASRLRPLPAWISDRVLVVLGHREPGISAEHRISAESRARLRHAEAIARRLPVRAAVLTGYTSTGGLSEAEQMKATWDEGRAPALLEVAGRDTAENASRSMPIILAIGEARHVLVVSSAWHLRVPWFFAPYREFGLRVGYRASFRHGNWPRMLREELRQIPLAPRRRREAWEGVLPTRPTGAASPRGAILRR